MADLALHSVRKRFGAVDVIRGVDLSVAHGEFVVFVGPSGCGKSTLLRIIAGLEKATEGRIDIGGRDVTNLDPARRGIAMVFQSYALYPHMTVAENIGFPLEMLGEGASAREAKVRAAARVLHLEPLLGRKPRELSGGQRQRVAIGRAIVREPGVFLFDEPLSNLDAELRVQMRLEIARLHQEIGATMIYVTHDQVEAMTLADRIVVLRAGVVEQVGAPLELYENPDNAFVAGFIGSPKMNFIPVTVLSSGRSRAVVANETIGLEPVEIALRGEGTSDPAATLGVRPEHFSQGGSASLNAAVRLVERLGALTYMHAVTDDGTALTIEARSISTPAAAAFGFEAERAFLFGKDGRRL